MARYALVRAGVVEHVMVSDVLPVRPGFTVVLLTANQRVAERDTYDGTTFTPYVRSAQDILREEAPIRVRRQYARLRQIEDDARAFSNIVGTPTAAQIKQLGAAVSDLAGSLADLAIYVAGALDG